MSVSREKASRMVGRAFDDSDDVGLAAGKAGLSMYYVAQFLREQSQTIVR